MIWIALGLSTGLMIVCLLRLKMFQRQIRCFTKMTQERISEEMNHPVTVDLFSKEFVELANELNAYTDEQKQISKALREDRQRLKNVVAGISHDFRTPLTASLGYLQLLEKSENLTEEERAYLQIVISKNRYLQELSDDFFELALLDSEGSNERNTVNLKVLIENVTLEQYDAITGLHLDFQMELPEEDVFLFSEEEKLRRILENLYSNAEKYAKSYIHCKLEPAFSFVMENDVEADLKVDMEHIFEPFVREMARSKPGNGLGLYVVKTLCDHLGISCEAELAGGVFTVRLKKEKNTPL